MKLFKNYKITKLKIILVSLFVFCFFVMPKFAEAGLIFKVPSSLGLSTGLVGHWTFDNKDIYGTTVLDKSGNGNNGTNSGAIKNIGKLGQGLDFDGVNDIVTVGANASLNNLGPVTISFWMKPESVGESAFTRIIGKDGGVSSGSMYILLQNGATAYNGCAGASVNAIVFTEINSVAGSFYASKCSANNTATIGVWQHIVVTWDGTTGSSGANIYKDGAEVSYPAQTASSGSLGNDSALNFTIGNRPATDATFDGLIDDVRVYNRVLSAQEIQRLYNVGAGLKISGSQNQPASSLNNGLVGHWTFDNKDIYNTTVLDKSGNGNNGTNSGAIKNIGKLGQALSFDGVNDYISLPNTSILKPTGNFTITSWIKYKKPVSFMFNASGDYFSSSDFSGIWFFIGSDKLKLYSGKNTGNAQDFDYKIIEGSTSLQENNWYFVTGVWDGSYLRLYLNGNEDIAPVAWTNAPVYPATSYVSIGAVYLSGAYAQYSNGLIDDVRVYNRALSAEEIKRLYNQGAGMKITYTPPASTCDNEVWYCDQDDVIANTLGDGDYVLVGRIDLAGSWKTSNTACDTPQCGLDGAQDGDNLVSSNTVDFTDYPARDACKAIGGRLPTITELSSIYTNRALFGTFQSSYYWSSTEYGETYSQRVLWINGSIVNNFKVNAYYVRCVKGN